MSNKSSKTEAEKKERVRKAREELEAAMDDLVGDKGTFAEQEQAIADLTRELQQEMTKGRLQGMSDGFGERASGCWLEARRTSDIKAQRFGTTAWQGLWRWREIAIVNRE